MINVSQIEGKILVNTLWDYCTFKQKWNSALKSFFSMDSKRDSMQNHKIFKLVLCCDDFLQRPYNNLIWQSECNEKENKRNPFCCLNFSTISVSRKQFKQRWMCYLSFQFSFKMPPWIYLLLSQWWRQFYFFVVLESRWELNKYTFTICSLKRGKLILYDKVRNIFCDKKRLWLYWNASSFFRTSTISKNKNNLTHAFAFWKKDLQ